MIQVTKPKRKYSRRRISGVAVIAIIIVLAIIWGVARKGDDAENQMQTAKPQIGTIEETVTAQGKLEPKEYVDVGAQVSGQLKVVHFEIGDVVKKGDLLAEIDPQLYESKVLADKARLKTLNAQLGQQQAQAVFAKQQQERNERLIKSDAVSKEALEETTSAYKVAQSGVSALKAQIEEAESTLRGDEANLSYTKIYAPMDGTVTSQTTLQGQTINANQQAPVILQIANLDIMTVRAQVAEADVMRLTTDMEVYFTTLGSLDKRWKGTIRQILPSPEVINDVVLYNALIDVDNKDKQLMTGMSTQIFFVIGSARDVMTIPTAALGKRSGETYSVKVKQGDKIIEKQIKIGLMDRNIAEVKSGLSPDDEVVVPVITKPEAKRNMRVPGPRI